MLGEFSMAAERCHESPCVERQIDIKYPITWTTLGEY